MDVDDEREFSEQEKRSYRPMCPTCGERLSLKWALASGAAERINRYTIVSYGCQNKCE